ncbi:MAG: hypothetical protein ACYC5M_10710 [Anaerolineae bacterium]
MAQQHQLENRWGGDYSCRLGDYQVTISEALMFADFGKGFALTPLALDRYEAVLRLRPLDTWLLKRMLPKAWRFDGQVFLSQRKLSLESGRSRNTIANHAHRLEEMGYIRRVSHDDPDDSRIHYSVTGVYAALALCVAVDPNSPWAKRHGAVTPEWASAYPYDGPGYEDAPVTFNLNWDVLERLAKRHGLSLNTDEGDEFESESLSVFEEVCLDF